MHKDNLYYPLEITAKNATLLPRECKQATILCQEHYFQGGSNKVPKRKNTFPPNEWRNIPFYQQ